MLISYGVIQRMFLHSLGGGPEEVIVECDWYECIGTNPRTHLPQIRRNHNFDGVLAHVHTCSYLYHYM